MLHCKAIAASLGCVDCIERLPSRVSVIDRNLLIEVRRSNRTDVGSLFDRSFVDENVLA